MDKKVMTERRVRSSMTDEMVGEKQKVKDLEESDEEMI